MAVRGLAICVVGIAAIARGDLSGTIATIGGPQAPYDDRLAVLVVRAVRNMVVDGEVQPVTATDLYGGFLPTTLAETSGNTWHFPGLEAGNFSLLAFLDLDGDGNPSLAPPAEPLGWYATKGTNWLTPVDLGPGGLEGLSIDLWAAQPLPSETVLADHGRFSRVGGSGGVPVLRVWGSPQERGFAHGALLGAAVRDFFRFFILQEAIPSTTAYEANLLPFLAAHVNYPSDVVTEVRGILDGMRSVIGFEGMIVPELGRPIGEHDLLFLNDYGCPYGCDCDPLSSPRAAATLRATELEEGHCSQFAFWGGATSGTDSGGTITGRNMDGENDFRKVTVSHFLAHAVEPDDGSFRYVHFMWPGFVGSASGLNERGVYVMMNDGSSRPASSGVPPARNYTLDTLVQREVLRGASSLADVPAIVSQFRNSEGGVCANGCNLVFAQPSTTAGGASTGMVYEGDRAEGVFRLPGQTAPAIRDGIMATNHFLAVGYSPLRPLDNFGEEVYFSSLWRYEAGRRLVDVFSHYDQKIGFAEMRRLLETVTHGTTEHSIIVRPDLMRIDVAVADLRSDGGWHAPYLNWTSHAFEDFFAAEAHVESLVTALL